MSIGRMIHLNVMVQNTMTSIDMNIDRMRELAGLTEGYSIVAPINHDEYPDRESQGLEGPFKLKSGLVVYYDKKEGKYYNPKTDIYLSVEEYDQHSR